jgi:hypothetical protein
MTKKVDKAIVKFEEELQKMAVKGSVDIASIHVSFF